MVRLYLKRKKKALFDCFSPLFTSLLDHRPPPCVITESFSHRTSFSFFISSILQLIKRQGFFCVFTCLWLVLVTGGPTWRCVWAPQHLPPWSDLVLDLGDCQWILSYACHAFDQSRSSGHGCWVHCPKRSCHPDDELSCGTRENPRTKYLWRHGCCRVCARCPHGWYSRVDNR